MNVFKQILGFGEVESFGFMAYRCVATCKVFKVKLGERASIRGVGRRYA